MPNPTSPRTPSKYENYGQYNADPTSEQLNDYFTLQPVDLEIIQTCRYEHTKLGMAVQLCTLRFLGTFGILGLVIMYIMANIALIVQYVKLRRAGVQKNWFLWVATPIIGLVVLAIPVWGDLRPGQGGAYDALPWLTIGLIALGILYTVVLSIVRPNALAQAPALLEGADAIEGDPVPPAPIAR